MNLAKCHSYLNSAETTDLVKTLKVMFKLMRNVNIVNGLTNSRIADKNLSCRRFCDAPAPEKSTFLLQYQSFR